MMKFLPGRPLKSSALSMALSFVCVIALDACGSGLNSDSVQSGADAASPPPAPLTSWDQFKPPPDAELRKRLSPMQYQVTRHEGTEPPFDNLYWDNKQAGIYVDIVSGEPLFSSTDKFRSGTGWPSFTRPLKEEHIVPKVDHKLGYARVEVRSRYADSHLGHVFDDGPPPTGLRYCINSAAIYFIPAARLEQAGYGEFQGLFAGAK